MTLAHTLLFAGGLFHVGMIVFHLLFARLFQWDNELPKLGLINRQLLPLMNNVLMLLFAGAAWLSFVYADDLISTRLGHAVLAGLAILWLYRAVLQVLFFRLRHWVSWLLFGIFLCGAAVYGAVWLMA